MKEWFNKIGEKISRWMSSRYGFDDLSKALSIAAIILMFLGYLPHMQWLSILTWTLLIWSIVRGMSKNTSKRQDELNRYYGLSKKITDKFSLWKTIWKERKTHVFFKCKNCGAVLRVPKGRGEIIVTCPKCKNKIDKKT